jgi:hypothetical protein
MEWWNSLKRWWIRRINPEWCFIHDTPKTTYYWDRDFYCISCKKNLTEARLKNKDSRIARARERYKKAGL